MQYHRISLMLTLLLILAGITSLPVQAAVPPSYYPVGPGDTYLALGDSLTTGEEASANDDNQPGYPDMLVALLRNEHPNLTFINVGAKLLPASGGGRARGI